MRIVVTGALGHIGSRLIRTLPHAFPGAQVVMVDNLSTQRYCSLFDLPAGGDYRFVEEDVLTADMDRICDGAEVVIHLAAITDAAASVANKDEVERVNFLGTEKVARACARTGAALLFVSTTSVYGTQNEVVDEDCPDADLQPQSPYAESKLRAEQLLHGMAQAEGLRHVTCRFGTIFGASPGMRFHTAINKFCWQSVNGLPITVWRTAMDQKRPYLELGDAVASMEFIMRRGLFMGGVFNVLTLNASVRDVLEAISAHIPIANVEFIDSPIMNQLSYEVANRRFAGLGFRFKGDLEQGVGETIHMLSALAAIARVSTIDQ